MIQVLVSIGLPYVSWETSCFDVLRGTHDNETQSSVGYTLGNRVEESGLSKVSIGVAENYISAQDLTPLATHVGTTARRVDTDTTTTSVKDSRARRVSHTVIICPDVDSIPSGRQPAKIL